MEITDSFLGTLKWEPDIYIGFSPALFFAVWGVVHALTSFRQVTKSSNLYIVALLQEMQDPVWECYPQTEDSRLLLYLENRQLKAKRHS